MVASDPRASGSLDANTSSAIVTRGIGWVTSSGLAPNTSSGDIEVPVRVEHPGAGREERGVSGPRAHRRDRVRARQVGVRPGRRDIGLELRARQLRRHGLFEEVTIIDIHRVAPHVATVINPIRIAQEHWLEIRSGEISAISCWPVQPSAIAIRSDESLGWCPSRRGPSEARPDRERAPQDAPGRVALAHPRHRARRPRRGCPPRSARAPGDRARPRPHARSCRLPDRPPRGRHRSARARDRGDRPARARARHAGFSGRGGEAPQPSPRPARHGVRRPLSRSSADRTYSGPRDRRRLASRRTPSRGRAWRTYKWPESMLLARPAIRVPRRAFDATRSYTRRCRPLPRGSRASARRGRKLETCERFTRGSCWSRSAPRAPTTIRTPTTTAASSTAARWSLPMRSPDRGRTFRDPDRRHRRAWTVRTRCSAIRWAAPRPAGRACSSPRSARSIRATGSARGSRGSPAADENLFELRITTPTQINPLVVYTTATSWTMPANLWMGLQVHSVNTPLTVAIRGATTDGTHPDERTGARLVRRHRDRAGRRAGRDRLLDDDRRHAPARVLDRRRDRAGHHHADRRGQSVRRLSLVDARRQLRRLLVESEPGQRRSDDARPAVLRRHPRRAAVHHAIGADPDGAPEPGAAGVHEDALAGR